MNPIYAQILVGLGGLVLQILYVAWRKGKDDQALQDLIKAKEELARDNKKLQDDFAELAKDLNRLWGYSRAKWGATLNGGDR